MTGYRDIFDALPADWPLREHSRRIVSRPHRWHVQDMGAGPDILLIHGAGGAVHSWRHLLPILARDCHAIAPDLPGQGFTQWGTRNRCGLDPMAEDLAHLCAGAGWQPRAVIGHSAGAAIALRLATILPEPPRAVIGINAALGGFDGVAGWLFPALARLLALNPAVPHLFARLSGSKGRAASLIASTGSRIDAGGLAAYTRLIGTPRHVDATLAMMAQWRLDRLLADLPKIALPCLFITAAGDRAVPPAVSARAATGMQRAKVVALPEGGHLVHEEAPERVAAEILRFLRECDVIGPEPGTG